MKNLIVAIIVVSALVLAIGVTAGVALIPDHEGKDERSGTSSSPPNASTPTEVIPAPPGLESFYAQQIAWGECGANLCSVLAVPLDYADPDGETIEIALEMAPAAGARIGSMVVNPGGPGIAGTRMAKDADRYFAPALRAPFDIVGFDPRGTGDSRPLDCITDRELDEYVAGDPAPDNRAELRDFVNTRKEFWSDCERRSGDLGAHVSTVEVARDMDVLRAALGEEKLTYFGFSYGTKLGATYAELFPARVGRFVLDGGIDPALTRLESALSRAKGFETALRSYVRDCVDGGDCFLGDSVDAGLQTVADLLAEVDEEPLPTSDERDLTIGRTFYGLISPLYSPDDWAYLDRGLAEALDGTGDTLLRRSDSYGGRKDDGNYSDNSLEAIGLINCLDNPWSIPAKKVPEYYNEFMEASPTFGRVFAWGLVGCRGTPFETTEPEIEIDAVGAGPIVVIGTTRDPATPYQESVALARQLDSGVLVSRDGDGHTAYSSADPCIDDVVHTFFIDGIVPPNGREC